MLELIDATVPVLTVLIAVVATIFLVAGIDDIVLDIASLIYWKSSRLRFKAELPAMSLGRLEGTPEKPIAMLVPTWRESDVIGKMLQRAVEALRYDNYHIYVGVYPNDIETAAVVKDAEARYPSRITTVVLDHDGPTTKSDNLNSVLAFILEREEMTKIRYEIFAIDDAEDYVPPHELSVMNYLIPFRDIVQLPVFPMETGWGEFTSGHYMDEFAQMHLKELPVRQWLTGIVPSAGVGTGFSRRAIMTAKELGDGKAFSEATLTEDYELPMLLARSDERTLFAGWAIDPEPGEHPIARLSWTEARVAVRSFFPRRFWGAVRQKTRWVIGITLQGWRHLGWHGDPYQRYMLGRDRKALIGNIVNFLGYVLVALVLLVWYGNWVGNGNAQIPEIVREGSWVWYVLIINLWIVIYRLVVRAICTYQIYGLAHAVLSAPRAVWGNLINFCATVRAIAIYLKSGRERHGRIPWDKTEHEFLD